jgi:hypothetical protein
VAVVQISRIQVRRGREDSETGVPQLAGGELAWAVDTQSLYIGNGAVSEGAPQVGNTKILTETDNIFELASSYEYAKNVSYIQTGSDQDRPVQRTLQDRLDDIVSVRAFGAVGDGLVDDTASIQRAIDQLFLNPTTLSDVSARITLYIPAGNYRISNTIYIPPFTTLVGDGIDKTVILQEADVPIFKTVDGRDPDTKPSRDDEQGTGADNQARRVRMEGMTIRHHFANVGLWLANCKDSSFTEIQMVGYHPRGGNSPAIIPDINWADPGVSPISSVNLSDEYPTGVPANLQTDDLSNTFWELYYGKKLNDFGIYITNKSATIKSENNVFDKIVISSYSRLVNADDDITDNRFFNGTFHAGVYGFVFGELATGIGAAETGPIKNTISGCLFRSLDKQAIWMARGTRNISQNNRYEEDIADIGAGTSIISFDDTGNDSNNDAFIRSSTQGTDLNQQGQRYNPEISGSVVTDFAGTNSIRVGFTTGVYSTAFRLPGGQDSTFTIDYKLSNDQSHFVRTGQMTITLKIASPNQVQLIDEYDFVGPDNVSESINFRARYDDGLQTIFVEYDYELLDNPQDFVYKVKQKS